MSYFAHHTTKRVDNITDVWRGTPSSPFFPHFVWTVMPRIVQNKTTYALIHKAYLPSSHSFFVSKYMQDALPSVYAEHTTLTSRHLIFVIWQNFAIQKSVFKDRKKNLGSHKSYEEAQQVGLFYSTAFFIKTNAKFSSSVLLFILRLLPVLLSNYSCAYFCRDSFKEVRTDCNYRSVSTSTKTSKTKLVCACMSEALSSTKNVMVV